MGGGVNRGTHCRNNHARTSENTYSNGTCKVCAKDSRDKRFAGRIARLTAAFDRDGFVLCSRGHRMTRATMGATGRCGLCRAEGHARTHPPKPKPPPRTHCRNKHLLSEMGVLKTGACRRCHNEASSKRYHRLVKRPEWRANLNERNRFTAAARRRKLGAPERQWGPKAAKRGGGVSRTVPSAPFVMWLEGWMCDTGTTLSALSRRAGYSTAYSFNHFRRSPMLQVRTVGRFLDAAGCPDQWYALYPTVDGAEIPRLFTTAKRRRQTAPPGTCRSGDNCARPAGHGPTGRFCEHHGAELDRIFAELNPTSEQARDFNERRRKAFVNGAAHRVQVAA